MARWTGDPEVEAVLEAASEWRSRCVLDDGSILGDERLWTAEGLTALRDLFRTNPIEGADRTFYDKLHEQLTGSAPSLMHLAAEVIWLLLLFPHHSKYGPERKVERVREVWGWAGDAPSSRFLEHPALMGVGNPGAAYLTRFPDEFSFVLDTMVAWKALPATERTSLMSGAEAPWRFAEWLEQIPGSERRPVRHAILFFLFPDNFENSVTTSHKRQVIAAFRMELPADVRPRSTSPTPLECDRALYALRKKLELQQGNQQINFYKSPYAQRWQTGVRDEARSLIASGLTTILKEHGLEARMCGSKKRTLADCGEVSESTGFWAKPTDATNKPLRWIIHLKWEEGCLVAGLAGQHGDKRIAFANTAGGTSGMVATRIIPAIALDDGSFAFYEAWEWTLLLGFLPALPAGSSGQLLGDFDPSSGTLDYMGRRQTYVAAALVALSEGEDTFEHANLSRPIRYSDATAALAEFVRVDPASGWPENNNARAA
ncbi:hypothetical protein [Roseomonas gilardii]|uniref:hypothetical protein n=1 Tax=Roseomonas gilardii TaxID=257708 RepID=UPI0011A3BAA4|nr:hypothetical protein [Roseomonas gilardii]